MSEGPRRSSDRYPGGHGRCQGVRRGVTDVRGVPDDVSGGVTDIRWVPDVVRGPHPMGLHFGVGCKYFVVRISQRRRAMFGEFGAAEKSISPLPVTRTRRATPARSGERGKDSASRSSNSSNFDKSKQARASLGKFRLAEHGNWARTRQATPAQKGELGKDSASVARPYTPSCTPPPQRVRSGSRSIVLSVSGGCVQLSTEADASPPPPALRAASPAPVAASAACSDPPRTAEGAASATFEPGRRGRTPRVPGIPGSTVAPVLVGRCSWCECSNTVWGYPDSEPSKEIFTFVHHSGGSAEWPVEGNGGKMEEKIGQKLPALPKVEGKWRENGGKMEEKDGEKSWRGGGGKSWT
eukprot:gene23498-biopygen16363